MLNTAEARYCVVYVTCRSVVEAEIIAAGVVGEKLAACVNIIPGITSFYFWQGAMQKDSECLMVIKTTIQRLPELEARVRALHSYTVPEFIAIPVIAGSKDYLVWLDENTVL